MIIPELQYSIVMVMADLKATNLTKSFSAVQGEKQHDHLEFNDFAIETTVEMS